MHAKLAGFEFCEPRQPTEKPAPPVLVTIDAFVGGYIAGRTDIKPATREHLDRARGKLVAFFGADRPLADVSPLDADNFRRHVRETSAENTTRRAVSRARQFFALQSAAG